MAGGATAMTDRLYEPPDFGPGFDPALEDYDPVTWADVDLPGLTGCPRCGGALTIDAADPSVGIFGDMIFCENDLPDGSDCGWGEGETP